MLSRRGFVATAALSGLGLAKPAIRGRAQSTLAFTPEQFGARGDGVTDDTEAFRRLSAHIQSQGGGAINLRPTTYMVGQQRQAFRSGASYAFEPATIIELVGLPHRVAIRGNGAILRCRSGLRYGTFDPITGAPSHNAMPYVASGQIASPYRFMIRLEGCRGTIEISDLELDGNLAGLMLGGEYGDVGRQIPCTGIGLFNNEGAEVVRRVHVHHHAQDGILIDGLDRARTAGISSLIEDVRSEYNGRQGCSMVGGRTYAFRRCGFKHTGKAVLSSPPAAGVDIEAEAGKRIRAISFSACEFTNNTGCGMVADNGDSADVAFSHCRFVGSTNWGAWPNRPGFHFDFCRFVGPIVHAFGDPVRARAARFSDCLFTDDPALSPTGRIYGGENSDRPIADLPSNQNVRFTRCRFLLTHRAALPWSTNVTYEDCTMVQHAPQASYPRGYFVGRTTITGPVGIAGSLIVGELTVNGIRMPQGRVPG